MERNAENTKAKLRAAATHEFAKYGLAGARVDRIAAAAGVNKQLIYAYYGSKQGLFDDTAKGHIEDVLSSVPITPDDLPGYAARLFDHSHTHPELNRLIQWYNLEGSASGAIAELVIKSMQHKITLITEAQKNGDVQRNIAAVELLSLILAISNAWSLGPHAMNAELSLETIATQRQAVINAVRRLVTV